MNIYCEDYSVPKAPGAYRSDAFTDTSFGSGITWGICQTHKGKRSFLQRFDCELATESC